MTTLIKELGHERYALAILAQQGEPGEFATDLPTREILVDHDEHVFGQFERLLTDRDHSYTELRRYALDYIDSREEQLSCSIAEIPMYQPDRDATHLARIGWVQVDFVGAFATDYEILTGSQMPVRGVEVFWANKGQTRVPEQLG